MTDFTDDVKIDGNLNVGRKLTSGNVRSEAWNGNTINTSARQYVDMPDMHIEVTTGNSYLYVLFVVSEAWVSENSYARYRLLVDDDEKAVTRNHFVSRHSSVVIHRLLAVGPGVHIIKGQWYAEGGTAQSNSSRKLTVIEM